MFTRTLDMMTERMFYDRCWMVARGDGGAGVAVDERLCEKHVRVTYPPRTK